MDSATFARILVGFGRATRPFAVRTRLFRLTDKQIWALCAPAHRSFTAPLLNPADVNDR
jgi:hypothetical protein